MAEDKNSGRKGEKDLEEQIVETVADEVTAAGAAAEYLKRSKGIGLWEKLLLKKEIAERFPQDKRGGVLAAIELIVFFEQMAVDLKELPDKKLQDLLETLRLLNQQPNDTGDIEKKKE